MITYKSEQIKKKKENQILSSSIKLDFIGIKYVFPSTTLLQVGHAWEFGFIMYGSSNYIVPKVDDQGNISGTYLMYNSTGYETPRPVKVKSG
jgi:hypothetical protein